LETGTLQNGPGEVGKCDSSSVSTGDDDVHGLDLDVHVVEVTIALLLAVLDYLGEDVALALARACHLGCSAGTLDDVFVCVEHFLHGGDRHKSQQTEEGHLDHDTSAHGELLEHSKELVLLQPY
jgi:hypothetical protein